MTIQQIKDNIFYPNRDYSKEGNPIIATIEEKMAYISEWEKFLYVGRGKKDLPARLRQIINNNIAAGHNIWEYADIWYSDCIFYKGDVNTTNDWTFITNGGGSYKVHAKYCIWETRTWINREKHPYDDKTTGLKDEYLYLGCERGPLETRVTEELAKYYFGLNYLGHNGTNVPSPQQVR